MAGGRRHSVMGTPDPRRAGSSGDPRPAAAATGPASHQTHSGTRGSGPASATAGCSQAGFSTNRFRLDVLVLVAGGRSEAG